jgi:diamine N-acetyltransferase
MFIKSEHIYLRALEKADIEILYTIENDRSVWQISNTLTPFSKDILSQYLENAYQDIYTTKQLRLLICLNETNEPIGTIDLFEFEPLHQRIGIGVLVFENYRKNGYAFDSIELVKEYAFNTLLVNQLYCNIGATNTSSQLLFKKCGFTEIGIKKQWNKISITEFEDEILFQCIK